MFNKVNQNSRVEDVVVQIEETIVAEKLKPGDKLAPLHELEDIFGTSQGTLREALRIVKQKGLVEVKLGTKGGVFIKEPTTDSVAQGLSLLIRQRKISLDDLAQFRKVIESGLMSLVIERATKRDINELNHFRSEFQLYTREGGAGWHSFLEVEVKLRKALIRMARNKLYETVLFPIHENLFTYAYTYLDKKAVYVEEAYNDWCKIIDAVERRDVGTAISLIQDHILRFTRYMKTGKENKE
jgi:GntR family transcriptional regulator, transcriptional repressor for pyruvate dehydrogenase complex